MQHVWDALFHPGWVETTFQMGWQHAVRKIHTNWLQYCIISCSSNFVQWFLSVLLWLLLYLRTSAGIWLWSLGWKDKRITHAIIICVHWYTSYVHCREGDVWDIMRIFKKMASGNLVEYWPFVISCLLYNWYLYKKCLPFFSSSKNKTDPIQTL